MKLRRYIGIILTTLILFSNIGLALNVHYCHGQLASVALAYKKDACASPKQKEIKSCCAKAAVKGKGCCKSHIVKLQDKNDSTLIKSLQLDLGAFCAVSELKPSALYYSEVALAKKETPSFYCDSHAPPLFKLYCQYIFYA